MTQSRPLKETTPHSGERRIHDRRQAIERRSIPSESIDVSRSEHENLYRQVVDLIGIVRRLEMRLHALERQDRRSA